MAVETEIQVESEGRSISLPISSYQGLPSTLCKGCGHNSITSYLIEAARSIALNPYQTVKLSGIGCSSKTPAYFLQASHGFNALHGRMPSVATGAVVANRQLVCIGVSGDGDTANIGLGQFKHACRRNTPMIYIIENNGCYGLTKGQFSATADLDARLRRPSGEANPTPPLDLCVEAIVSGATFVARSFSGDKKQLVPLLKAALGHKGIAVLDVLSPCVTFNDFQGSTKSWVWGREHEEKLQDVGHYVRRLPEIEVEQAPGEATNVQLHDGSWITLRALKHKDHDIACRDSALRTIAAGREAGEFLTGLLYLDTAAGADFVSTLKPVETPLSKLPDEALRPSAETFAAIMESL